MTMPLGGGAVATALNETLKTPVGGLIDAVSDFGPVVVGIVHRVVASPFTSVTAVGGVAPPPPATGSNVTVTPMTGCEFAPVTRTLSGSGSSLPAAACCPSPLTMAMLVAPVAVAVNVTEGDPGGPTSVAVAL